jgi:dihydroorotate dehydrogenase electron transfer subunit
VVSEDVDGVTVIDLLKKYLPSINNYDYYLVSGPKAVLDQVVNLVGDSLRGYVLTESLMKCGLGFCGSCALKDFLVCRDGTLVDASRYRWLIS